MVESWYIVFEVMLMARVVRQIRIDPEVEEAVLKVAELEGRSFSNAANWLLEKAAGNYLVHGRAPGG